MLTGIIILTLGFIGWHFAEKDARSKYLDTTAEDSLKEKLNTFNGRVLSLEEQQEYLKLKKTRMPYHKTFMHSLLLFLASFLSFLLLSNLFENKYATLAVAAGVAMFVSFIYAFFFKKEYFNYVFLSDYVMYFFFNLYAWIQIFYTIEINGFHIPIYLLLPYFGVWKFLLKKLNGEKK